MSKHKKRKHKRVADPYNDYSLIHIDSVLCFKEDLHSVSQKVEGITFDMPTFEERGIDSIIVCDNLLNNPLSAFQKVIFDGVKHGLSVQIAPYLYTQLHQSGLLDGVHPQSKISTISLEKFCLGEQLPKVYPINVPVCKSAMHTGQPVRKREN